MDNVEEKHQPANYGNPESEKETLSVVLMQQTGLGRRLHHESSHGNNSKNTLLLKLFWQSPMTTSKVRSKFNTTNSIAYVHVHAQKRDVVDGLAF